MRLTKITLIPVLILATFLAFSLRLVEVVSGAKNLSVAFAETNAPMPDTHELEQPHEEPAAGDTAATAEHAEDEHKEGMHMGGKEAATAAPVVEAPKWMDATDADSDAEAVRMDLLKDLSKRREELDQREKDLMTREALIRAAETELDEKYQELSSLRTEIETLLQRQSEEEKARTTSLVKIYEGMKPQEAARIFDTLDLDILVSVVSQMSERKLSPVMAAMNPERARTITIMLAEEKQLPVLPQN